MNLQVTRRLLAGFSLVALIAIVVGCTTPSSSLSPTGPTAVAASSAAAAVNFSPNPETPPSEGPGCSPGYWKNHETEFAQWCAVVFANGGPTCALQLQALTCKGSEASCGRNAAAGVLNGVSGCTESN